MVALKQKRILNKNDIWPKIRAVDQDIDDIQKDLDQQIIHIQ